MKGYWRGVGLLVLPLLLLPVLLGAKACAVHVPNGPYYGTWSVPARFDLRDATQDPAYTCATDPWTFDPLITFYGLGEWMNGPNNDDTLGLVPFNFALTNPAGVYVPTSGQFRADKQNGFYTYHLEGVVFADRAACMRGEPCDFFLFQHDPANTVIATYEVWAGWSQGTTVCQHHYTGVALGSTFHCAGGGGAGCVDHQTAAWVPYTSLDHFDPCDWHPDVCVVGTTDPNGNCPPATPYGQFNGLCCSCP